MKTHTALTSQEVCGVQGTAKGFALIRSRIHSDHQEYATKRLNPEREKNHPHGPSIWIAVSKAMLFQSCYPFSRKHRIASLECVLLMMALVELHSCGVLNSVGLSCMQCLFLNELWPGHLAEETHLK